MENGILKKEKEKKLKSYITRLEVFFAKHFKRESTFNEVEETGRNSKFHWGVVLDKIRFSSKMEHCIKIIFRTKPIKYPALRIRSLILIKKKKKKSLKRNRNATQIHIKEILSYNRISKQQW